MPSQEEVGLLGLPRLSSCGNFLLLSVYMWPTSLGPKMRCDTPTLSHYQVKGIFASNSASQ